jgi:rubredoxin
MEKWQCTKCEYVYDPQLGDPENDVPEGTEFDELPKKWVCPECGSKKRKFEPLEDEEGIDADEEDKD